jgi:hypothetical protein
MWLLPAAGPRRRPEESSCTIILAMLIFDDAGDVDLNF